MSRVGRGTEAAGAGATPVRRLSAQTRVVRAGCRSERRIPRRLLIPNNEPEDSPGPTTTRRNSVPRRCEHTAPAIASDGAREMAREDRRERQGERDRARAASSPSNISWLSHSDSILRRRCDEPPLLSPLARH